MEVQDRIAKTSAALTPAERRVAEVVLARPQLVAFGTVAELAHAAACGAATVVRLSTRLGYDGFTELQKSVQDALSRQLRPAAERIREPAASDVISRHIDVEVRNVTTTLQALDAPALGDIVTHLARTEAQVFILSGDASYGVARQFCADMAALRQGVQLIEGNDVAVRRAVALIEAGDTLVALDLRRYDRWLIDAVRQARAGGCWCVAVTDSLLSPLASMADRTVTVAAASGGPFDSHVGTLAMLNLMVAAAADRLRTVATDRLDRTEAAWRDNDALTDR